MLKIFIKIFIVILVFTVISCKTIKTVDKIKPSSDIEKVYDNIIDANPEFRNLEIKSSIKFEGGKNDIDLKSNIKIVKDSLIWVSLSWILGIEAVRVKCTNDSIFIVDRINKTIRKTTYQYINKNWKIDVDFNSLQSILVGKLMIYPSVSDTRKEFVSNFTILNDPLIFKIYRKNNQNVESLLKIDRENNKIFDYLINDGNANRSLSIVYAFDRIDGKLLFPKNIDIKSFNENKLMNVSLNYSKVQINNNPSFPFSLPTNYTIIDK